MTLGERIQLGIDAKGVGGAEIGRRAGFKNRSTISRIKSGELPGHKYLEPLAQVLGCSVEWLTTGTGPAPTWADPSRPHTPAPPPAEAPLIDELRYLHVRLGELIARYEVEQVARAAEPVGDYRAAASELIRAGLAVPDPPVAKNTSDEESDTHLTPRR